MQPLIEKAIKFLEGKIRKTPIEFSPKLSEHLGQPVYLKLECLQLTGSFKVRGGFFYLSTLKPEERKRGVAACSAGNHGLGVAYAGKELQVPCTVFVPKSIDQAKYNKLIALGAHVKKSDFVGYDDTLAWAENEAKKLQIPLIPAFDDEKIMAANGGTLAAEVLEEVPDATHFVLPMGGGGLSAGFSWVAKNQNSHAQILICQLAECPALKLSLEKNKPMTYMPPIDTLAGGLEGGLGAKCFEILKTRVDKIALISEQELKKAVCWLLEHHQYLIEPSAAVALASCLYGHIHPTGPTVIVLTGRNVSYSTVRALVGSEP
ncbi:MAG TPA: pyridoxal-phosphate dependent enzyme [Rhabdochlamydiaceae bacterium]|nr:pyridoxal-phosphate dependent enzyme [Rhabdochlamydiaceae bacterium]